MKQQGRPISITAILETITSRFDAETSAVLEAYISSLEGEREVDMTFLHSGVPTIRPDGHTRGSLNAKIGGVSAL